MKVVLSRHFEIEGATIGIMGFEGGEYIAHTLEPGWRSNSKNLSCIPAGTYECVPYLSQKFGPTWRLQDTAPRVGIVFHAGNTLDDTQGCILVGGEMGRINGKIAVLDSRQAMDRMRAATDHKRFTLEIRDYEKRKSIVTAIRRFFARCLRR